MYTFREVQSKKDYHKIFSLRYKVYCIENEWIDSSKHSDKLEIDSYDKHAEHFIATNKDGDIVGTIRIIIPSEVNTKLPISQHPSVSENQLIYNHAAEISRLAVDKRARRGDVALGLYRIMYQYSKEIGIKRWYIVVDTIFLRILQKLGFPFDALAKPAKYMGTTIPATLEIEKADYYLPLKNRSFYEWFQKKPSTITETKLISRFFRTNINKETKEGELFSRNWAFISSNLQRKIHDTRMFIAGSGLGSVVAEISARVGFGKFIIADGDQVELSNLNRQAFHIEDLNQNKAKATSKRLKKINRDVEVEIIEDFLTPANLDDPISRSDLVVNTIDFDHPAFLDCNKKAGILGKPVLFPLNIGWGGALFIFTHDSSTIEQTLELSPDRKYSFDEIKQKLILKIVNSNVANYLLPLFDVFEKIGENGHSDPQTAVGCSISASLVVTSAISIISNKNVKVAPEFTYIDFHQLIQE